MLEAILQRGECPFGGRGADVNLADDRLVPGAQRIRHWRLAEGTSNDTPAVGILGLSARSDIGDRLPINVEAVECSRADAFNEGLPEPVAASLHGTHA